MFGYGKRGAVQALAAACLIWPAGAFAGGVHLTAHLDGGQVVPAVETTGSGHLSLILSEDGTQLGYELAVEGLDPAEITGARLQLGAAGVNGPELFVLSDTSFDGSLAGTLAEVDLVPQPSLGVETFDQAVGKMLEGMVYGNVLTMTNPDGEIRGQVGRIIAIELRRSINPRSKGVVKVHIPSTEEFDAGSIDPTSILFGPGGAEEKHGKAHGRDPDGDGRRDLVLHFKTRHSGIACGDDAVGLVGFTSTGLRVEGEAPIRTVGCPRGPSNGKNAEKTSEDKPRGKGKGHKKN